MADSPGSIGDLSVTITGDYGPLADFLNIAENLAQNAGQKIGDSLGSGAQAGSDKTIQAFQAVAAQINSTGGQIDNFAASANTMGNAATSTSSQISAWVQQLQQSGPALDQAGAAASSAGPAFQQAGTAASNAALGFTDIVKAAAAFVGVDLSARALLGFAEDAIETYANVQKATIAIDALTGSVGKATGIVAGLRDIALEDALSFPTLLTAEQRMLAFGISADKIPGILRALADAAAATNKDIGTVSQTFDRIIETGTLSGRALVQLGLNMKDVASAMGVTESAAKSAFQALDQEGRIQVVEQALSKFAGTAQQVAASLSGQWQNLQTQTTLTFQAIGESLAPLASQLLSVTSAAVQQTGGLVSAFNSVGNSVDNFYAALKDAEDGVTANTHYIEENKKAVDQGGISWRDFIPTVQMFGTAFEYATDAVQVASGTFPAMTKSVNELEQAVVKASTAGITFKNAWDLSQVASGFIPFTSGMSQVDKSITDADSKVQQAKTAMDMFTTSYENNTKMANGQVATLKEVETSTAVYEKALKSSDQTQSANILTNEQLQLKYKGTQESVEKARQAVTDADKAWKDGTGTMEASRAAHDQLTKAIKAAGDGIKDNVLSLGELTQKHNDLSAAARVADSVYAQVTARINAGSKEYDLQAEALKQLIKVHKDLGDAQTNVNVIIGEEIAKNNDLVNRINGQFQAWEKLDQKYGENNLLTTQAYQNFEKLAQQTGLTAIQFAELTQKAVSLGVPLKDLVNSAASAAEAFKTLGITSSAHILQMASDYHDAAERIKADANSTAGDRYAAASKEIEADQKVRDSQTASAQAAKELGITTVQMLQDTVDKYSRAAANIGDNMDDIVAAHKKVQEAQDELRLAIDPIAQAMQRMGIQSVDALTKVRDQAQADLDLLRASGAEYGIIEQATKKLQDAQDNLNKAIYGVGETGTQTGHKLKAAFDMATVSAQNFLGVILSMERATISGSMTMESDFTQLTMTVEGLKAQLMSAAQASDAFWKSIGGPGAGTVHDALAALKNDISGPGSLGTNTIVGQGATGFTVGSTGMVGSSITLNGGFLGGASIMAGAKNAQEAVDFYMSQGYSFGDAKNKARGDQWPSRDVNNTVDKTAGHSSSSMSSPSVAPVSTAVSPVTSPVPGMSPEDVAAFAGMGVSPAQLAAVASPGEVAKSSIMSMSEPSAAVAALQALGPSALMGMSSPGGSVSSISLGPAQLAGMSGGTFAPATPTSNFTGAGLSINDVRKLQGLPPLPSAPVTPNQMPDMSTLQFGGGLSPTSTLAQVQALAASTPALSSAVTAPTPPSIGASAGAAGATSGMNITTQNCSITVTGSLSGGTGTTVNVYATVSNQAMSDSLVKQIQGLGTATGKI